MSQIDTRCHSKGKYIVILAYLIYNFYGTCIIQKNPSKFQLIDSGLIYYKNQSKISIIINCMFLLHHIHFHICKKSSFAISLVDWVKLWIIFKMRNVQQVGSSSSHRVHGYFRPSMLANGFAPTWISPDTFAY